MKKNQLKSLLGASSAAALSILLTSMPTLAGGKASEEGGMRGGGGNAVVCRDAATKEIKSAVLYDYFEATTGRGWTLDMGPATNYIGKFNYLIARLSQQDLTLAQIISREFEKFESNTLRLDDNASLPQLNDSIGVVLPGERLCPAGQTESFEQAAVRRDIRGPGDKKFVLKKSIWNAMDEDSKAGLVMHEIVYSMMAPTADEVAKWRQEGRQHPHENSVSTRFFNSHLASTNFSKFPVEALYRALNFDIRVPSCGKFADGVYPGGVLFGDFYIGDVKNNYSYSCKSVVFDNDWNLQIYGDLVRPVSVNIGNQSFVFNTQVGLTFNLPAGSAEPEVAKAIFTTNHDFSITLGSETITAKASELPRTTIEIIYESNGFKAGKYKSVELVGIGQPLYVSRYGETFAVNRYKLTTENNKSSIEADGVVNGYLKFPFGVIKAKDATWNQKDGNIVFNHFVSSAFEHDDIPLGAKGNNSGLVIKKNSIGAFSVDEAGNLKQVTFIDYSENKQKNASAATDDIQLFGVNIKRVAGLDIKDSVATIYCHLGFVTPVVMSGTNLDEQHKCLHESLAVYPSLTETKLNTHFLKLAPNSLGKMEIDLNTQKIQSVAFLNGEVRASGTSTNVFNVSAVIKQMAGKQYYPPAWKYMSVSAPEVRWNNGMMSLSPVSYMLDSVYSTDGYSNGYTGLFTAIAQKTIDREVKLQFDVIPGLILNQNNQKECRVISAKDLSKNYLTPVDAQFTFDQLGYLVPDAKFCAEVSAQSGSHKY